MTTDPTRYRHRTTEIEAVQWTGTNAAELRAFCGPHFDTIDPEDRIEDGDQDAQVLIQASYWTGISPGRWVLKFEDHLDVERDEAFRAAWEAVAVPAPAGRDALRDRIAETMARVDGWEWAAANFSSLSTPTADRYRKVADAVLAELPDTARLHDQILTQQAELAQLRDLLRTENQRANSAIDRETTAEEAEEEQRLALSQAFGLGTGAPWDAIQERAAAIASCPGVELSPNPCRCPCYGCKHHCGAHDPSRMADEAQQPCGSGPLELPGPKFKENAESLNGAAVLNEAARTIAADAALRETEGEYALAEYGYELARLIRPREQPAVVAAVAGEEPDTETPPPVHPTAHTWTFEVCYEGNKWHGCGGTYDDRVFDNAHETARQDFRHRAETDKQQRAFRLVRATTTYTVEAEHTPAASQPDESQEAAPVVPQCDGCGHLVHRARKCPAVRYGERCECDEPITVPGKEG